MGAYLSLSRRLVQVPAVGAWRLPTAVLKSQRNPGLVAGRRPLAILHLPCWLCKSPVLRAHLHGMIVVRLVSHTEDGKQWRVAPCCGVLRHTTVCMTRQACLKIRGERFLL